MSMFTNISAESYETCDISIWVGTSRHSGEVWSGSQCSGGGRPGTAQRAIVVRARAEGTVFRP